MRQEMDKYEQRHPTQWGLRTWLESAFYKLSRAFFEYRVSKLSLGSTEWHVWQERLSHWSSVGHDLELRNLFYARTLSNCGDKLCVFPNTVIYYPHNIKIGYNVFINRNVFITAPEPIIIGDNALVGPFVVLNSGRHNYADSTQLIRDQGHTCEPISIGDDVWLGAHVVVMRGVTIGKGAVVGAGAVVTRSVEPYTVVAGVPARQIGRRTPGGTALSQD